MDLAFDRDRGGAWWERDWRGYARYAALIPIPLVLHFISSDPIVTSSFGPAQLLSPRLAASAPVWTGLLAWPILLIGIGCFVLDQLSRIGDRKTGVRFVGFASSWFFVSAVIAPILTDGLIAGGALTGMLGVIGGFSVLLFRLSTRLESEHQIVTPRQVSLAWQPGGIPASASSLAATDDHSTADTDYRPPHALTQTLDRLADLRPRIISHGSDLPQEERNHLESLLDPLLCLSASVIEFSSGPSPWAVHVASRVGQYTMLSDQPSSSDRDTLAQHLEGLEGCSVLELSCWKPDSDARKADVILAAAGFPTDPSLASQILDQLAPDGVVVTLATDSVLASSALTAVSSDARPFAMARAAESVSRGESS